MVASCTTDRATISVKRTTLTSSRSKAEVPSGTRAYVVGDIHGRADLLGSLLDRIDVDLHENPVGQPIEIFLGDYVDRGPNSRGVIEQLIGRKRIGETIFLKGNHETFIPAFLKEPKMLSEWRNFGGLETLLSYGIKPSLRMEPAEQLQLSAAFERALPKTHWLFLNSLPIAFICGDYYFVHAGVRPGIPLGEQHEEDLLWIRDDFLLCEEDFGKIVVHGHSPVKAPDIRPNRINIDTGAYATGQLTCLVLEGDGMRFL